MNVGGCNIDHIIQYESGHEPNMPNYMLHRAVAYYREKSQKDLDLDIRALDENNNIFQLYTNPDMLEIGRDDKETMICLKNKMKSIEFNLVEELKAMIKERDALVNLSNNDFKQKIKTMMAKADDGSIPGECSVESNLYHFLD